MKIFQFKEIVLDERIPLLKLVIFGQPEPLYGSLVFPITNDLTNASAYFDSWTEAEFKIVSNPKLLYTKIHNDAVQKCKGFIVKCYEIISFEVLGYNYPQSKNVRKLSRLEKKWFEFAH